MVETPKGFSKSEMVKYIEDLYEANEAKRGELFKDYKELLKECEDPSKFADSSARMAQIVESI